jgi:tetraacyldisaccharide 4'-kinase
VADWRARLTDPHPSLPLRGLRWLLRGLSLPYGAAISVRNWGYHLGLLTRQHVDVPVISVGNLSVGGTGKTPTVAWICRWFRQHDVRVAIVSRGYGQLESGPNDEALELELRLPDVPHVQNPDRHAAARLAQDELGMQLIVLDDGFQHRRLARNLDLVLIDATDPPAAQHLLPGGLLREPWSSLRRAQLVLLTRCNLASPERVTELRRLVSRRAPQAACVECSHVPRCGRTYPDQEIALPTLQGQPVLAFCAIGNPPAFFRMLEQLGLELLDRRVWPDHHAFQAEDVASLSQWAAAHGTAAWVVCTMKDWVKLRVPRLGPLRLLAIEIDLELGTGGDALERHLQQLLDAISD